MWVINTSVRQNTKKMVISLIQSYFFKDGNSRISPLSFFQHTPSETFNSYQRQKKVVFNSQSLPLLIGKLIKSVSLRNSVVL